MRYELLLQSLVPGEAVDWGQVIGRFCERGAVALPAGGHGWALPSGVVEVHPLLERGVQVGLEVRIPLSGKDGLAREAVVGSVELAREAQVRLFDPQLLRPLESPDDAGAVADQYLRTARYAGEMLGVPEALGAAYGEPEALGLAPTTKLLLGAVALIALALGALEIWARLQSAG